MADERRFMQNSGRGGGDDDSGTRMFKRGGWASHVKACRRRQIANVERLVGPRGLCPQPFH